MSAARRIVFVAVFALLAAPPLAGAGESDHHGGHHNGDHGGGDHHHGADGQDLVLEGHVAPRCALTGEGLAGDGSGAIDRTIDLSNPHALADVQLNLHVDCTQHFVLSFIPRYARMQNVDVVHGALQPATIGDGYFTPQGVMAQGFVGALRYRLHVTLDGRTLPSGGGPAYQSPGGGPGVGFFSAPQPAMSAPLSVTFDPVELPAALNLLAGAYQETITIQLTPQGT